MSESRPRRFPLSLLLRVTVALAGIAFIVYSVTWTDHVQVTGPYPGQGEAAVPAGETVTWPVVEGDAVSTDPSEMLTLRGQTEAGATVTLRVRAVDASDPRNVQVELRPGILRTISRARIAYLVAGLAIVGLIFPIQMVRWWWLLRARQMHVSLWQCFKLLMVGTFSNFFMPGSTGGDVVKAYYAARYSDRRADAVMSIIIDRVVGLVGLIVLAGIVGLFMLHDPKMAKLTAIVWAIMGGIVVGAALYFSRRLRKKLGIERLIGMLPGQRIIQPVDQAAVAYSEHKVLVLGTVGMSVVVHVCLSIATALAGYALGLQAPLATMLTVVPVLFLAAALPISYLGFGVMEALGLALLQQAEGVVCTPNQVITMLLLARLYLLFYGLLGSVFLFRGDIHLRPEEGVPQPSEPAPLDKGKTLGEPEAQPGT